MNSDLMIELHVRVHAACLAASGERVTEHHKQIHRESLQQLVRLARIEYARDVAQDMDRASAAMRSK